MDDINDIRKRHEQRRQLTRACAGKLQYLEAFRGKTPAYTLYMQVPTAFLGRDRDPGEKGSVDLLICRASDGLAAMAFVFDIGGDKANIPARLACLRPCRLELPGGPTGEELSETATRVLVKAGELPADPKEVSGSVTLNTCPLKQVRAREGIDLTWEQANGGQLFYKDGAITPYGVDCRLVLRRVWEKNEWITEVDVLSGEEDAILQALRFSRDMLPPSQIPLRDRMESVKKGEPADSAYPAHMAKLLDELLAAPLDSIMDPKVVERVRELLPGRPDRSATYDGALLVIHDLLHRYLEEDGKDRRLYDLAGSLMDSLIRWLREGPATPPVNSARQQSLRQRLANIQGGPARQLIGSAPLFGYLQGASARLGTGYPLTLFRSWKADTAATVNLFCLALEKGRHRDGFMFDEDCPTWIPDGFFHLYSFLVEPFHPDVDLWRYLEKQPAPWAQSDTDTTDR